MDKFKQLENVNIGEVCRACFETCEQYKMLFEIGENSEKRSWGDVFFDVVKIEAPTSPESSPCRICLPCCNDLLSAFTFIQKSKENNDRLLEFLKTANIKQSDCLSEFPIDIPKESNTSDYLHIKVEDESINEYCYTDDKHSAQSSSESEGSDDEPLFHKQGKHKKMQCTYCNRIFKRWDFFENHMKRHEEDTKQKDGSAGEALKTIMCDECEFTCNTRQELKLHQISTHTSRMTTTPTQINVLLEWMEKYPSMVNASHEPTERKMLNKRWNRLSEILNEHGPPTKSMVAWRKTWVDYKHRAKSKFSRNKRLLQEPDDSSKFQLTPIENKIIELVGLYPNTKRFDEADNTVMASSLPLTSTTIVPETIIGDDVVRQLHESFCSDVQNSVDLGSSAVGQWELPKLKVEKCSSPKLELSFGSYKTTTQNKNDDRNKKTLVGLVPYTKLFDHPDKAMIASPSPCEFPSLKENECMPPKQALSEKPLQTNNESKDKTFCYRKKANLTYRFYQEVIKLLSEIRDIKREELELKRKRDKDFLDIEHKKLDLWEQELKIASAANNLKEIELKMKKNVKLLPGGNS